MSAVILYASSLDMFQQQPASQPDRPHIARATGNPEWYSPAQYVEAARRVLGAVDLDPASCELANRVVQAARIYTAQENGLQHPWSGRVWLNPPYSARLVKDFVARLVNEYEAGAVTAAMLLVNNATETRWFQQAARASAAICYPDKRVRFYTPDGSPGSPLQGQALFYFGPLVRRFKREFSHIGIVTVTSTISVTRCLNCDGEFSARAGAKYCQAKCRQAAHRARAMVTP